jgi:hypothetical protein
VGSVVNEREAATASPDATAPPRPARQNVDEAIVVRWRDGIAIVELVSIVRRKHRRRAAASQPPPAAPAACAIALADTDGDSSEESER